MSELKDKFNKMKGKRNQAGSPPYFVNEILKDIIDKVESGTGGGTGGDIGSSTYPIERVVLDENTTGITLKPNIWYDINHSNLENINLLYNFQEFYNIDGQELNFEFKFVDEMYKDLESAINLLCINGGILTEINNIDGYKYEFITGDEIKFLLSENPYNNKECVISIEGFGENIKIHNIITYNEMYGIDFDGELIFISGNAVESDIEGKYKYLAIDYDGMSVYVYCDQPINLCESGILTMQMDDEIMFIGETFIVKKSVSTNYIKNKNINEFVFTINTPVNINSQYELYFNGDNIPDYTAEGKLTISIINGVACWTFKPN